MSDVDYYVAFGYWKLACILEGVYARYKGGVMGESSGFEGFARQVEILADAATVDGRQPAARLRPATSRPHRPDERRTWRCTS